MILYPAIDILGGKAVRLMKGEYDRETRYFDDPADAARQWADGGAQYIHVVGPASRSTSAISNGAHQPEIARSRSGAVFVTSKAQDESSTPGWTGSWSALRRCVTGISSMP